MKRKRRQKRKEKIEYAVADIETVSADGKEEFNSKFYLGGIYSKEKGFIYFSNIDYFLHELKQYKVVFFHNLNFDLQVLLKNSHLIDECKALMSGSRIINAVLKIGKDTIHLADSMNIYNMSLEKLEKSFGIQRKTSDIKHDRKNLEQYNIYDVMEYLEEDCKHLYDILKKTFEFYGVVKMTIASLSYHKLLNDYLFNNYKKESIIRTFPDWIREAYKGGRVEVFKRYGKNLYYYDVNSLYPTVMFKNKYPLGRGFQTKEYIEGCLGIYHIKVNEYKPIGVSLLSIRNDGKLLFVEGKNYEAYLTSVEIEYMKEHSEVFDFEVEKGIYFLEEDYIFEEFIDYFYNERKRLKQEGNPLEQIYKLTMNSCYGKFAEKEEKEQVIFSNNIDVEDEKPHFDIDSQSSYKVKKEKMKTKTNVVIASFITAYARIYISDIMNRLIENGYEVYYCDTDSIVSNANQKQMESIGVEISDELGAMKLEYEIEEGYFVVPKVYYIKTKNKTVIKAKGFDIKTMKEEDVINAYNGISFKNKSKRMNKIKTALKKKEFVKINDVEKRLLNTISDKRIYIEDKSFTLDKIYENKDELEMIQTIVFKKDDGFLDKEFYYYLNRIGFTKDVIDLSMIEEFKNLLFNYYEDVKQKEYYHKINQVKMRVRYRKKVKKEDIIKFFYDNMIYKEKIFDDIIELDF